nr:PREDICTED: myb-related transcription factor, partner of profilin-like [Lepisosteus oculatus]
MQGKKKKWDDIANCISACSAFRRSGTEVRRKWHDCSSLAKRRAELNREKSETGGGQLLTLPLTPEEERVLGILGPSVTEGIPGGVDVSLNELPSTSPQPASPVHLSSRSSTGSSPGPSCAGLSQRAPPEKDRESNPSGYGEELVALGKERLQLEKEQLQLKQEELQQRERHYQELVLLNKAKLDILAKQLALAEAQFNRPSNPVPIMLPSEQGMATTDQLEPRS